MTEELKVIISAEISKLKQACSDAKQETNKLSQSTSEASEKIKKAFSTMGEAAKKIGKGIAVGMVGATAALGALGKKALGAYGDFEQLEGGIKTLFGTEAATVEEYAESVGKNVDEVKEEYYNLQKAQNQVFANAKSAYKEAGMSANEYMETVTSFSASLIASLDGDTVKAAEISKKAVTDMADNANKMGSTLESIQNAYKGFSKQNYTMLDNLKLGYGGTKEEMQRLLTDAEKFSGMKFDMSNFADIVKAIGIIQDKMGITGTTAREAAGTIQGSLSMVKGSWENLVAGLMNPNADIGALCTEFVDSISTALSNIIPRIKDFLPNVISAITKLTSQVSVLLPQLIVDILPSLLDGIRGIINGISAVLPELLTVILDFTPELLNTVLFVADDIITSFTVILEKITPKIPEIITKICDVLVQQFPTLLKSAVQLFSAILSAIPDLIVSLGKELPTIIDCIIEAVTTAVPLLLDASTKFFHAVRDAIPKILPPLIEKLPEIITTVTSFLINMIPQLLDSATILFNAIIEAIPEILPVLIEELPKITYATVKALSAAIPAVLDASSKLFQSIVSSLGSIIPRLASKCGEIVSTIKNKLVEKAKNLMKFDWSFPKLKLPHFSIKGEFSLTPPKVPRLAVNWYAQGGVFEQPTLFNYGGNNIGGLGEAGAEAIVPLENNTKWLDKIAEKLSSSSQKQIVLQVDGTTFAKIACDSINDLARQQGSLPLAFV